MKLLSLSGLLVCCLSLAEAADFKHFPVLAGRTDSVRTEGRGAPAPARPPGKRERVGESVRKVAEVLLDPSSDYSDEDEDVPKVRVTSTTQRTRVNRNRNRSRTRVAPSEKKVDTTAKPARQRIRIRTQAPRLDTSTRSQRPTVERASFTTVGLKETTTKAAPVRQFNDFPAEKAVIKQAFNQAETTFSMDPFLEANPKPAFPTPKLIPNLPSATQSFSQSLNGLFNPSSSPSVNHFTEEKQQDSFVQAQTQPQQPNFIQAQNKPQQLTVFTQNQVKPEPTGIQTFQAQAPVPQPFQAQTFQAQSLKARPILVQPFRAQPVNPQLSQTARPQLQGPSFPRTRQEEVFQSQPFQTTGQSPPQAPQAPTFQERPSLFATPIEIPQQEGAGASFSYEAVVG